MEKEISINEEKLRKAMINGDVALLDVLVHDQLLFTIPNGMTLTKAMDLNNYESGRMNITSLIVNDRKIECIGDTVVVVANTEMKGYFENDSLDGNYQFTRVWKAFDNQWKVIAGSSHTISNR